MLITVWGAQFWSVKMSRLWRVKWLLPSPGRWAELCDLPHICCAWIVTSLGFFFCLSSAASLKCLKPFLFLVFVSTLYSIAMGPVPQPRACAAVIWNRNISVCVGRRGRRTCQKSVTQVASTLCVQFNVSEDTVTKNCPCTEMIKRLCHSKQNTHCCFKKSSRFA